MTRLCPAIAPCRGEHAAMEFRTVLKVPAHGELAVGCLPLSETARKEGCHESRKHHLSFYGILLIVLVLIALQSGDSLVGSTQLDAQLLATPEEVSVGIGERSRRTQVACRIGSFRLEGDGRWLVGADLDMAVEKPVHRTVRWNLRCTNRCAIYLIISHFTESDIGILHSLQSGEVIVGSLQGRGAVGLTLLQSSGIEQHTMAQMDAVAVVAQIADVANLVTRMVGFGCIAVCLILQQVQGHGNVFLSGDGVGRKLYEVFIETEVSIVEQSIGDAFALSIQGIHGKSHTRLDFLVFRLIEFQNLLDILILYVILHLADMEWFAGMQHIGYIHLWCLLPALFGDAIRLFLSIRLHHSIRLFLSMNFGLQRYSCMQESLVLHGSEQVAAGELCLQGIIHHRLLAERVME